ncbi:hypothetical protein GCM10010252_77290 [Streptomyces aureoverticillatus]|nr:hypothetical protein GCM10010252_77290 [Streptomyces aureoverticillatus]
MRNQCSFCRVPGSRLGKVACACHDPDEMHGEQRLGKLPLGSVEAEVREVAAPLAEVLLRIDQVHRSEGAHHGAGDSGPPLRRRGFIDRL